MQRKDRRAARRAIFRHQQQRADLLAFAVVQRDAVERVARPQFPADDAADRR